MVDESLAHGQARHLQRELRAEWDRVWARGLEKHGIERVVHSEARAKKVLDRLEANVFGERAIAVHRYGDLARTAHVAYPRAGDTLITEWELAFVRERRHEYALDAVVYTTLVLEPHAVARILQRKHQLEIEAVSAEMRAIVGALTLVGAAIAALELLQFAIPTDTGLIAGVVDRSGPGGELRAKTFMTQLSPDRVRLRETLAPHVINVRSSATFERLDFRKRRDALIEALRPFTWLREPLEARRDVEKERWASAPSRTGGRVD